jgi:hypothetical protein
MRRVFRMASVTLAIVGLAAWFVLGANRGWTKTTQTKMQKDPVTEIDYPVIEKRFLPGIDLLALWLGGTSLFFGASFLTTKSKTNRSSN